MNTDKVAEMSARIGILKDEYNALERQLRHCKTIDEYDKIVTQQSELQYEIESLIALRDAAKWGKR